jgi:hypothetical protein
MILTSAQSVDEPNIAEYAWSNLRRFHHTDSVKKRLVAIHSIPKKHWQNANKQAEQIRKCLIQAREYRDAANVVSICTKPLLLYYSIMSLAIVHVLLKNDGSYSLDMARAEHSHHGLNFTIKNNSSSSSFVDAAKKLGAKPVSGNNGRRGTFELWHRTAREDPIVGDKVVISPNISTTTRASVSFVSDDKRMGIVKNEGITLLDVFLSCPDMFDWNRLEGLQPNVVRARLKTTITGMDEVMELFVHPTSQHHILHLFNGIKVDASAVDKFNVIGGENGAIVRYSKKNVRDLRFAFAYFVNVVLR